MFGFVLSPLLVGLALVLLHHIFFTRTKPRKLRLPPDPPSIPVLGHFHLLRPPLHRSLQELSLRYGPLLHVRLGSTPLVVVASPEMAGELFKKHEQTISDRPLSAAVRRFAYGTAGFAFAPYGPYWRFMRRLCMSELLGGVTVKQLYPVRRRELFTLLRTLLDKSQRREVVDVSWELIKLTNNVIMRMTASTTSSDTEEARKLVKEVAELVGQFNLSDFVGICRRMDLQGLNARIDDVHARFDAMMERILSEKEETRSRGDAGGPKDLLDIMLDVSEDKNAEVKITRDNIKSFILDVYTAGSDSSAATVEWALAELINHPDMLDRAQTEIDSAVGRTRVVDESDVPNLPYLQAVVKETLRLHPAAPLATRISTGEIHIAGYDIPAGTQLFLNAYSIGRDPWSWEEPLEFRPERFLHLGKDGQDAVDFRGQHFQMLPFGSGRRVCPGISLALQVVQATLAVLLQCFDWRKVGGRGEEGKVDMSEGVGMVIPRAKRLVYVPVARLDPFPAIS